MPEICDECQEAQKEIEKQLKKGELKEEDLIWKSCEKCGYLRPVKKLIEK